MWAMKAFSEVEALFPEIDFSKFDLEQKLELGRWYCQSLPEV